MMVSKKFKVALVFVFSGIFPRQLSVAGVALMGQARGEDIFTRAIQDTKYSQNGSEAAITQSSL